MPLSEPWLVAQVTSTFGTTLPLASFTMALKVATSVSLATMLVLSTVRSPLPMVALALSETRVTAGAFTAPAVPTCAVTCAVPTSVPRSAMVALPLASVLLVVPLSEPWLVAHVTSTFGTTLPLASFTMALKVAASVLSATMLILSTLRSPLPMAALALSATRVTAGALTAPDVPTWAVTCAVPASVPRSVMVASPLALVLLVGPFSVPRSVFHTTSTFGTTLPLASFTMAVKVAASVLLATMLVLSTLRSPLPMLALSLSATKVTTGAFTAEAAPTCALTCTLAACVCVRLTVTTPLSSVTPVAALRLPASLPHVTVTPGTTFWLASFTVPVKCARSAPLAVTTVLSTPRSLPCRLAVAASAMNLTCTLACAPLTSVAPTVTVSAFRLMIESVT